MENRKQLLEETLEALKNNDTKTFREDFFEFHPIDQIEMFHLLDKEERKKIYQHLTPDEMAPIFQEMELSFQKEIADELDYEYAVKMFNEVASDDLADFFEEIPKEVSSHFIDNMDKEEAEEVSSLLLYDPQTAGAIMTTEYLSYKLTDTVQDVMDNIRLMAPEAETIYYLYVVDQLNKLVGVVSLRDLIIAPLDKRIEEIMSIHVVTAKTDTDQEEVAKIIKKYDFLAMPVTDEEGVLVGIVTVDDVLDVIEDEITEDFGEISAARGATGLDISAWESSKKRLPWLILLLFIGMMSASIIGNFEETLEAVAILAIFIPLIMDTAGNTGTQSLAVVVRGLALGNFDRKKILALIKREFFSGLIMGSVCGVVVTLISQVVTGGNLVLGFIVGVSLFFTLLVSTLAGTIIPFIIHRFKIDPAVASGPFITTINDIVGLVIYFSIATSLIAYL